MPWSWFLGPQPAQTLSGGSKVPPDIFNFIGWDFGAYPINFHPLPSAEGRILPSTALRVGSRRRRHRVRWHWHLHSWILRTFQAFLSVSSWVYRPVSRDSWLPASRAFWDACHRTYIVQTTSYFHIVKNLFTVFTEINCTNNNIKAIQFTLPAPMKFSNISLFPGTLRYTPWPVLLMQFVLRT